MRYATNIKLKDIELEFYCIEITVQYWAQGASFITGFVCVIFACKCERQRFGTQKTVKIKEFHDKCLIALTFS